MKIFDCFMYFDEEIVLDLRLNLLDKYVDHFVIVESNATHKGEKRSLKFDISKYKKFQKKIIYLVFDQKNQNKLNLDGIKDRNQLDIKIIQNAIKIENAQRNYIFQGLELAKNEDLILISDVDEIPNLDGINFYNIKEKLIFFNQLMFSYKFNLMVPNFNWIGTKGCKKKHLLSPQWLRNTKHKKYPFYRLDTLFSKLKYTSIKKIENGGWHFTNIKNAEDIKYKFESYLHHREFDLKPLSVSQINNLIQNKQMIYDLSADQRINKIGSGGQLKKIGLEKLPKYIIDNLEKFKMWMN